VWRPPQIGFFNAKTLNSQLGEFDPPLSYDHLVNFEQWRGALAISTDAPTTLRAYA
jgi:hypothetical protein